MIELYVCDLCGNNFSRAQLDNHFVETAKQAAKLTGVTWSGKLVTFDTDGKAWCPHCFKDAKSMQSGRRTVHVGERRPYLRPPNIGVSYKCKCGRYKSFNCRSVNLFTGLELTCADCGAVLFVPPTIFDHSKPSEYQGASLRPNYQEQMIFVEYRKRELDERFRLGTITEDEYKEELRRRGL